MYTRIITTFQLNTTCHGCSCTIDNFSKNDKHKSLFIDFTVMRNTLIIIIIIINKINNIQIYNAHIVKHYA